ncbi:probable H/ACA ribonucleoprotein complex subunit 1 [Homalodisca vitripennis]|uniref:probable H/ACA ribonucleoprotein complex subunit 1 n=1 Tax=Homalodisca vitripennis TaxID=197043 RepID=UPI001EEC43F5|nr:probable H/ACA ribonucleoprotein complex subunit 1 [Homalodisca vitripennis]XP_046664976.1 probable H/ACA ribonucleoprotein complex subunit 1 [Homalodisca vitripennis]XP_046664977.1 probable H/ACA ribonucleoprotein complex subunit 1 [Homalodisca vitripennis]
MVSCSWERQRSSYRGRAAYSNGNNRRIIAQEPLEKVTFLGCYVYSCEDLLVCKAGIEDVPYFNANVYLENKSPVGKIDDIFGNPREYYFSVTLNENSKVDFFKVNQKLYIDPAKILPLRKFLPQLGTSRGGERMNQGRGYKQRTWNGNGCSTYRQRRQTNNHAYYTNCRRRGYYM